jgi:DNA-binding Lrp family transcriptional regulator
LGAINAPKSVEQLSRENDIPLSTCYRRVNELLAEGVLVTDRIVVTPEGKRYELLRSAFRAFSVTFDGGSIRVDAVINEDVADKLRRVWLSMRG